MSVYAFLLLLVACAQLGLPTPNTLNMIDLLLALIIFAIVGGVQLPALNLRR